jgi:hypothetical protein
MASAADLAHVVVELLRELAAQRSADAELLVDVMLDAHAYRLVAQRALHLLHDQGVQYERLRQAHTRVVEEYRTLREQHLIEAGADR